MSDAVAGEAGAAIAVYRLAGKDKLQIDEEVRAFAYLFGGDGNNLLIGCGGPSFLSGGAGDDTLFAAEGPSVLIGGQSSDNLHGGDGNAFMIAGSTAFDTLSTPAAFQKMADVLTTWNAPKKKFAERAVAFQLQLAGHVFSDNAKDVIHGGDGWDLFYVGLDDQVFGKKKGDIVLI